MEPASNAVILLAIFAAFCVIMIPIGIGIYLARKRSKNKPSAQQAMILAGQLMEMSSDGNMILSYTDAVAYITTKELIIDTEEGPSLVINDSNLLKINPRSVNSLNPLYFITRRRSVMPNYLLRIYLSDNRQVLFAPVSPEKQNKLVWLAPITPLPLDYQAFRDAVKEQGIFEFYKAFYVNLESLFPEKVEKANIDALALTNLLRSAGPILMVIFAASFALGGVLYLIKRFTS